MVTLPERGRGAPTLTRALLLWLLTPLFILLAVSAYTTYRYASHLAETERDLVLEEITDDIKDSVSATLAQGARIDANKPAFSLILQDAKDQRYFAIYDAGGTLLAGDPRLTRMLPGPASDERAVFDNFELGGNKLRRAAMKVGAKELSGYEIQVAETLNRRGKLALRLSRGVLVPQAIVLIVSFPLIWLGISRGLRPLEQLRQRITRRSAQDLDAIPAEDTPRELQPVVGALNRLLSQVKAAQEEQRRFTADAAHQIKTPLAALTAEIELARKDTACACAQPTYQRLHEASSRLAHLVRQLLALAHSETHGGKAQTLFDLAELAREVTGDYVSAAADRNIDLGFEGEEQAIPLRGSAVLVREAMRNLVENALKYTPEGGIVTVAVRALPPVFSVADSGPGVAEAERSLIFQRFHRAPESGTTEGSGLGLAIVQEVARSHGATVSVSGSALGGALFEFRFADSAVSQS